MIPFLPCMFSFLLMTGMSHRFLASPTEIYHYLPEHAVSHCTRKLNTTGQVGCSSGSSLTSGSLFFINDITSIASTIKESSAAVVFAMDFMAFLNESLMYSLRSSPVVAGLIVFAPSSYTNVSFSESNKCPNALYSASGPIEQCNVSPSWNPYGKDYSTISWPFPVVLVQTDQQEIKDELFNCYEMFNIKPNDDTRCTVEFNSAMSAVESSTTCVRRQTLMSTIFEEPELFCEELTGVNIVLSASNTSVENTSPKAESTQQSIKERPPNSSLLIVTRMDSRSMFEKSGFASQGILPSVAVLLSTAVHLMKQPAFKNLQLERDLFFVFLDNEAYDFMGSRRFADDLTNALLSRYTGLPLAWQHVYGVVELGEIGLSEPRQPPRFYMLSNESVHSETASRTAQLMDALRAASGPPGRVDFIEPGDASVRRLPLPPTASLQTLLAYRRLPHLHLSDYAGPPLTNRRFESFMDVHWPPIERGNEADKVLLAFAETLSDALHRLVVKGGEPLLPGVISPSPGEFLYCFTNASACGILNLYLSSAGIKFLADLKTPVPTQSYLPINQIELKLSHLVNVLLVGLVGQLTDEPECPTVIDKSDPYAYVIGYYNGSTHCYRTLMDTTSSFITFKDDQVQAPGWVRSRLANRKQYIRWYRSASQSIDGIALAIGLLLIGATGVCAFSVRHRLDIHANSTVGITTEVGENAVAHSPMPNDLTVTA